VNKRILIVEDDSIVAFALQRCLSFLGYTVAGTTDRGDHAIRIAGELCPDLVLMDIELKSDIDGVAAAQQIRDRFQIPVVYLTGRADEATLRRTEITKPFGFLVKPFDELELQVVVDTALRKHEAERRSDQESVCEGAKGEVALLSGEEKAKKD
jgi:CheY-like chemotaxis protein